MQGNKTDMDVQEFGNTVAKYAPLLGAALATASPITGVLINAISALFGTNPNNISEIIEKIKTDPEGGAKLKQIEAEHETELKNIALQAYIAQLTDLQHARSAKLATERFTGKKDWLIQFLVISIVIMVFMGEVGAFFAGKEVNQLFSMIVSNLTGSLATLLAFYFSGVDPKKLFENMMSKK